MTPSEQEYVRHQARLLLQAAREREAAERASRCGSLATFDGFEDALVELILEKFA
jgi:hypothetical protein